MTKIDIKEIFELCDYVSGRTYIQIPKERE